MPLDDLAKEAPIRLMKAEQDPSKASSADQHSLQVAALDTASEALELGLSAPNSKALQKEAATKAKARAKKRTQDEIAADELQKAREEFDGLLKSLGAMFDGKAFGNELGKVDRSVQRKLRVCGQPLVRDQGAPEEDVLRHRGHPASCQGRKVLQRRGSSCKEARQGVFGDHAEGGRRRPQGH